MTTILAPVPGTVVACLERVAQLGAWHHAVATTVPGTESRDVRDPHDGGARHRFARHRYSSASSSDFVMTFSLASPANNAATSTHTIANIPNRCHDSNSDGQPPFGAGAL